VLLLILACALLLGAALWQLFTTDMAGIPWTPGYSPFSLADWRAAGAVPTSLDRQRKVASAMEVVGAFSGNYESKWMGMQLGAYVRRFNDADPVNYNPASYTEGILAVRPHIYWNTYFHTAAELSFQARRADGVDFIAGRVLSPEVFRLSVLPLVAPLMAPQNRRKPLHRQALQTAACSIPLPIQ
jgi:hypothetical protein